MILCLRSLFARFRKEVILEASRPSRPQNLFRSLRVKLWGRSK